MAKREMTLKVMLVLESDLVDQKGQEGADVGCCAACVAETLTGYTRAVTSVDEQGAIGEVFQEIAVHGHARYEVFQGTCGKHASPSVGKVRMIRRKGGPLS